MLPRRLEFELRVKVDIVDVIVVCSAGEVQSVQQDEVTVVNSVFFDEHGGAFVDFTRELVDKHPGGSTGELFTIRSVVQTLARNFPEVEYVAFLVDGREIETVAGHIDAAVPFDVEQYR